MKLELPPSKTADVHYYDKVAYFDKFSQTDTRINTFYSLDDDRNTITVKGIRIDDFYTENSDQTDPSVVINVPANDDFKAYFILSDGTEREMTEEEKEALVISYVSSRDKLRITAMTVLLKTKFGMTNSQINDELEGLEEDRLISAALHQLLEEKASDSVPSKISAELSDMQELIVFEYLADEQQKADADALAMSEAFEPTVSDPTKRAAAALRTVLLSVYADENALDSAAEAQKSNIPDLEDQAEYRLLSKGMTQQQKDRLDSEIDDNVNDPTYLAGDTGTDRRQKVIENMLYQRTLARTLSSVESELDDKVDSLSVKDDAYLPGTRDDDRFGSYNSPTNDFLFEDSEITVENPERYQDNIYTLHAVYNSFETDFDLVFAAKERKKVLFTRQVIFRSDVMDDTSTLANTNISYFEDTNARSDDIIRSDEYEFTFIILRDESDGNRLSVYNVLHNGISIPEEDREDIVAQAQDALKINAAYRSSYSFSNWSSDDGSMSEISYNSISDLILSELPSDPETVQNPVLINACLTD